ncbi:MAG: oligosaccharide flippase family protein [Treponema sp.]|nr:oligosaccharide flippase family protein [Treponema sp.]
MNVRYKKLLSNTAIFSMSQFASKFLSFLLIPIYTKFLTTADYGTADLVQTTVTLLITVLSLYINSSVLRFIVEDKENLYGTVTFAAVILLTSIILVAFSLPLLNLLDELSNLKFVFLLTYIVYVFDPFLDNIAKGINRIKVIGITSVIKTILALSFNLLFIVKFKFGVQGYLYAYVLGIGCVNIIKFVGLKVWRFIHISTVNKDLIKKMLKYSLPLVLVNIGWWLNNSINKYIITFFLSATQLGLYTAASKFPSILAVFQTMTGEALNLSIFEEYKKVGADNYYSILYNFYNFFIVLLSSLLISFSKLISSILFSNDFVAAWSYAPLLVYGSVFSIITGFIGSFFSAAMKNSILCITTLIGALFSVVANLMLVPRIGIYGTAITFVISNVIIWVVRFAFVRRMFALRVKVARDIVAYMVLLVQTIFVMKVFYIVQTSLICLFVYLVLYEQEIKLLLSAVIRSCKKIGGKYDFQ